MIINWNNSQDSFIEHNLPEKAKKDIKKLRSITALCSYLWEDKKVDYLSPDKQIIE